eukprot:scaffold2583_cov140-Isochrysis_galbana.AAC.1
MQMQHRPRLLLRLSAGLIHPPSQPEDDVEVRLEDQKAINTFGRLNTRLHELTEEIKEKRSLHDQLDDAANELILADDDEPVRCDPRLPLARVQYGECYFEVQKDRADELLESRKDKISAEVAELEAQVGGIQDTLGGLKKQLYARFGGNINLEEQ